MCSIGNPTSAYRNTRHSAGHAVLELIRETLEYPAFEHSHQFGGRVSRGLYDGYTLFESSSYMNLSGKPVASAWKTFQRELDEEDKKRAMLVVLHDNLDKPMGVVKVKKTGSANGHNGITSIINSLGTKVRYMSAFSCWIQLTCSGICAPCNRNRQAHEQREQCHLRIRAGQVYVTRTGGA